MDITGNHVKVDDVLTMLDQVFQCQVFCKVTQQNYRLQNYSKNTAT